MSAVVRISEGLLTWIDAAIDQAQDTFGVKRYLSRRDVVDDAVKKLLVELGVKPKESPPDGVDELKVEVPQSG